MVAREPRRASPATKRMREARTWASSESLLVMSCTMRRQSRVALGRSARRARTRGMANGRASMLAGILASERSEAGHGAGGAGMLNQRMVEGEAKRYWVRTEQGRVWGPFPAEQLARLKGQITDKAEVSLDGRSFRPVAEFSELQPFVVHRAEPRRTEPPPRERPAEGDAPYIGPGLRAMFSRPGPGPAPAAGPSPAASAPPADP